MTAMRNISHVTTAVSEPIADLQTFRAFPTQEVPNVNPFLFLNHHGFQVYPPNNNGLPFGPHPHKGFETLTFVFDGEVAHTDSTGETFVTGPGGVQWMTAGSGIVHAEVSPDGFRQTGGPLEIIQIWMNLPAALKRSKPWYQGLEADGLATEEAEGWQWVVVSGETPGGTKGPVDSMTGLFMSRLDLSDGARFETSVPAGRALMLYVVRGAVRANGVDLRRHDLPHFGLAEERLVIEADADSLLLLCHGKPIDEPIVAHGPFVMNTAAEIHEAIEEYQSGAFGRL